MIIIETCPKCGHDLINIILASNPPIPKKECWSCGWSWTGKSEEVVRIPFGGNNLIVDDLVDIFKDVSITPSVLNNIDSGNCIASTQHCSNTCVDGKISTHHIDCIDGKIHIIND